MKAKSKKIKDEQILDEEKLQEKVEQLEVKLIKAFELIDSIRSRSTKTLYDLFDLNDAIVKGVMEGFELNKQKILKAQNVEEILNSDIYIKCIYHAYDRIFRFLGAIGQICEQNLKANKEMQESLSIMNRKMDFLQRKTTNS